MEIARYGVFGTPAVVVDGKVKSVVKIPDKNEKVRFKVNSFFNSVYYLGAYTLLSQTDLFLDRITPRSTGQAWIKKIFSISC